MKIYSPLILIVLIIVCSVILSCTTEKININPKSKEWKMIESSPYFSIGILSLENGVLDYELILNKDLYVWGHWVTFVSADGQDYSWYCEDDFSCDLNVNDKFLTEGTKRRIKAQFNPNVEKEEGAFYFYLNVIEKGKYGETKKYRVVIEKNRSD